LGTCLVDASQHPENLAYSRTTFFGLLAENNNTQQKWLFF